MLCRHFFCSLFILILAQILQGPSLAQTPQKSGTITLQVEIYPAGSFEIKGRVKGRIFKEGDQFSAGRLRVRTKNLKTGIWLRDGHLKKKLKSEEFPEIILRKGIATKGKGQGIIEIMGIKKPITCRYKVLDGKLLKIEFELDLSHYQLTGISYKGVGVKNLIKGTALLPYFPKQDHKR